MAMNKPQNQQPRCCSEAASNRVAGFTCLPNWLFGQATAQELVVLLALQHHAPNIHPSLATLARVSGLGKSTVCRILLGLKERGWLRTERRATDGGGNNSTSYHLLIWAIEPPSAIVPVRDNLSQSGGGLVPERDINKMNLRIKTKPTALEPPLPPTARGELRPEAVAARPCRDQDGFLIPDPEPQPQAALEPPAEPPAAVQPQPQQPQAPRPLPEPAPDPEAIVPVKPKARKREAGFVPAHEDVPAALLPVVRELLAFWPARKGAKTLAAWELLCSELQRIQNHPQGGTEIVRGQLEQGTTAGIDGKAWQSIRFANWLSYGTKAGTPIIGSGFAGKRTTMDRVMGAIALVENREREAAAAQQAEIGGLVLAEVA
jgi:hypothetical protein